MSKSSTLLMLLAIVCLMLPASRVAAEEESVVDDRDLLTHAITINLVEPIWGGYFKMMALPLTYQVALHPYVGLEISPGVMWWSDKVLDTTNSEDAFNMYGMSLAVGPRINFTGKKLNGWYVTPRFQWEFGQGSGATYHGGRIRLDLGYTFTWDKPGWLIQLGAGFQYIFPLQEKGVSMDIDSAVLPYINVSVGYGF